MRRDPLVLTFVFAFPIVTMLIIGGAFGTTPDRAFDFTNPAHWYVASYLTVVIAAVGLVMLPVHLASYRERGVLRRFAAAGFPRWSFAIAQLIVGLVTTAVACALLLAVAAPVYGMPAAARRMAGRGRAAAGRGRLREHRRAARLGAAVGPVGAGGGAAALLPLVPARRGRSAAARDGLRGADGGRPAAADPADQRGPRAVAGHRAGHRVPGRAGGPRRGGDRDRRPPGGAVTGALPPQPPRTAPPRAPVVPSET